MPFLALTKFDGTTVRVNSDQIIAYSKDGTGTWLEFAITRPDQYDCLWVQETPQQLDRLLYVIHPLPEEPS